MWLRWLNGNYINQISQMVKEFGRFGIIVRKNGPDNDKMFPTTIYVELMLTLKINKSKILKI